MAPQFPLTSWPGPPSECRFGSFHLQSSPSFLEKWWKVQEFPRLDLPISELAATRTLPPPSIKVLMVSTLMLPPKSERSTRLSVPKGSSSCSSDIWAGAGGLQTSHNQSQNSSLWRPKTTETFAIYALRASLPFSQWDGPKLMAQIPKLLKV